MNKSTLAAILILLAGTLFFFNVWSPSLYDAAETTYGEFIKQIRLTHDWLTLHYNGQIIFDKPPLFFWLATLATYLFGMNELAIRFWAATSGVLTVVLVFYLASEFYNERTGLLSGLVCMTAFQFLIQSRIAEIDILLTLLLTAAFYFFYLGYKYGKTKHYLLFYIAMGLAVLTKGIIGAAIPLFTVFLFLLFKKELGKIKELRLLPGIAILLLIGSPWYLAEWWLHGDKFVDFALGFLFMSRFKGVVSGHPGPWYYYFLSVILGFAPWSHFLPYGLVRTWKQRQTDPALMTLCFIIPVFVVFSVAQTKLPSYLLPIFPFLAIMVGRMWDRFMGEEQAKMRTGMLISNLLLAVVVALLIIGFVILGTNNYSGQYAVLMPQLLLLAGVLIGGSLLSIGAFLARQYDFSFFSLPVMVFIIAFILVTQTLPAVEKFKGTKELAERLAVITLRDELIAAYDVGNRPGIVFYNKKPILFLENEDDLKMFTRLKLGYCFVTEGTYEKIKDWAEKLDSRGDLVVVY